MRELLLCEVFIGVLGLSVLSQADGKRTVPPLQQHTNPIGGYCPRGYIPASGNKCYKLVKLDDEGVSWDEARRTCQLEPGRNPDIASIHGVRDTAAITALIQDYRQGLWIGLKRASYLEPWTWADTTTSDYLNWGDGEPRGTSDHCAEIWVIPGPAGTWNNIMCTSKRSYVCQTYKDASNVIGTPALTTQNTCNTGYQPYWYACYKAVSGATSWENARSACNQDGGYLVSIHSESENAGVMTIMADMGLTSAWIGLNDKNHPGTFYWSDNWHVVYTNWGANQPSSPPAGGCTAIDNNGKWSDVTCTESKSYICKQTSATAVTTPGYVEGVCPSNNITGVTWHEYGSYCYATFSFTYARQYLNWNDARSECLAVGGEGTQLASLHDLLENTIVMEKVKADVGFIKDAFWSGLRRDQLGGSFSWVDGSPVAFFNWAPGEPNGDEKEVVCGRVYLQHFPGMWDDNDCDNELYFTCKKEKVPPPTTPVYPEQAPGRCPGPEWLSYGSDCLLIRPDDYATWSEAQEDCRQLDSELTTVHSEDENWHIHKSITDNQVQPYSRRYWIGLTKQSGEDFTWSDGSDVDFFNWGESEPNPAPLHDCVEVYGGGFGDERRWRTAPCNERRGYVCRATKGGNSGHVAGIVFGIIGALIVAVAVVGVVLRMRLQSQPSSGAGTSGSATSNGNNGFSNVAYDTKSGTTQMKNNRSGHLNQ